MEAKPEVQATKASSFSRILRTILSLTPELSLFHNFQLLSRELHPLMKQELA